MKVLVHDYSGHPFQAELSRELAVRGHDVLHSYCAAYSSGKGRLEALPGESVRFEAIGRERSVAKESFWRRLVQEISFGLELIRSVHRERPDVLMFSNTPLPTLLMVVPYLLVRRMPWALWHQDVQATAIRAFAGSKIGGGYRWVADAAEWVEKWCARRSTAVVAISEAILDVHRLWGTGDKTHVIPNWAPVGDITPRPRDNNWSREQGLSDEKVLLYSGTLGLKHNPRLLPLVARAVREHGVAVRLVVVNEGPAVPVVRKESTAMDVPLTVLPFQPYERLPEVLGTGDVLLVLLEPDAGSFSVPSKTLSYLCAGRPILGMMPAENAAATLIEEVGGRVLPPTEDSVEDAAKWIAALLSDADAADRVGCAGRELAEREFALEGICDRFETVLRAAARQ